MSRRLREGWLIAGVLLAVLLSGFLVVRAVSIGRWARSSEESIRPWMSVPYLAHTRHVPQAVLWNALGIAPHRHDHRPIGRIARQQKKRVDQLMSELESAIAKARKNAPSLGNTQP